jgi:predicted house-cleaning noncanonical NTP pyrophosphatase (MazG superfamily)
MTKIRKYNKIVRTKIPAIIRANGSEPEMMDGETIAKQTGTLFKQKLQEEINELIEAKSTDEILDEAADVVQAVIDYLITIGHSVDDLEIARAAKEIKRGTFLGYNKLPVYLIHVEDSE